MVIIKLKKNNRKLTRLEKRLVDNVEKNRDTYQYCTKGNNHGKRIVRNNYYRKLRNIFS